jgi:hypothetical protein
MQSGTVPPPPSLEMIQTQQAREEEQLRQVLGDAGFAAFKSYQATIPDRSVVETMNQQGANLSASQSSQLLQVLTSERQQIQTGHPFNGLSPQAAITALDQQQALLEQAVSGRVQNLLSAQQVETLRAVMSQQLRPAK